MTGYVEHRNYRFDHFIEVSTNGSTIWASDVIVAAPFWADGQARFDINDGVGRAEEYKVTVSSPKGPTMGVLHF